MGLQELQRNKENEKKRLEKKHAETHLSTVPTTCKKTFCVPSRDLCINQIKQYYSGNNTKKHFA